MLLDLTMFWYLTFVIEWGIRQHTWNGVWTFWVSFSRTRISILQKNWGQTFIRGQTFDCTNENPFDFYLIKVMEQNSGRVLGHLPMYYSRATKFLLDCGTRIIATLTSCNYCVSPLVQWGLEIPCLVETYMPTSFKNKYLNNIYTNYVDLLYYEQEKSNIVGVFLDGVANNLSSSSSQIRNGKSKKGKKTVQFLIWKDPEQIYIHFFSGTKTCKSNIWSFFC